MHYEVFPTIPERWRELHRRALGGEVLSCDRDPFQREDGSTTWVRWKLHPWRDERDAIGGIIMFTEVITDQVEGELKLKRAIELAEQANEAKSRFLAHMSHEIRTPMNGVLGVAELLTATELNQEQRALAETLKRSSEALLAIINDILDLSKIEAGRVELECRPFDLRETFRDVLNLMAPAADTQGLVLSSMLEPGLQHVLGDEVRLRQILTNLLGNALKFTREGSVEVRARRGAEDRVHFEVEDTGIGIDPELRARLFKPFSQVDASITRRFGGTGLGLAISRHLAEMMGGEIDVVSSAGKGSVFWFEVHLPAAESVEASTDGGTDRDGDEANGLLRVLLVDDNGVNRLVGEKMLERLGHQPTCAEDGEQALRLLREDGRFDFVLMDVQMPVMDGLEATRRIRSADAAWSEVPIVALTAHAGEADRARFIDNGMDDCLIKPLRMKELQRALRSGARGTTARSASDSP